MVKLGLAVTAGLAVGLLAGFIWGSSGRAAATQSLQVSELRAELLGARAQALDARVAIYSVNFGEASQHLEDARGLLTRAQPRLTEMGRADAAAHVQAALASIDEAQRMAGQLDQGANSRAGDAAKSIADALAAAR